MLRTTEFAARGGAASVAVPESGIAILLCSKSALNAEAQSTPRKNVEKTKSWTRSIL
jgi:hypothetical protein